MRTATAKQFLEEEGLPLMWWTLRCFRQALGEELTVVVVLNSGLFVEFAALEKRFGPAGADEVVAGGAERFDSVKRGLACLGNRKVGGVVGVHDAVRPVVDSKTIASVFSSALQHGSAIPVVPLKDSVRQLEGSAAEAGSVALDRSLLRAVQTPQCFDFNALVAAYDVAYSASFTDDASVYERTGLAVHLVDGDPRNIKVTTPEDLVVIQALLQAGRV
jgi:2-C-methyl-D-erythritol 4-phosphate cytidylyltransferase